MYIFVISRKLWKNTVSSSSVSGVFVLLGDRPHFMYVADDTISAVSLHGEDKTSSLPVAWTSIDNPRGIGISPDGGRGVVRHSTVSDYHVTTLILESGEWRQNTTYRLMGDDGQCRPTITQSGEVITVKVSMTIYMYYD